ncbi:hypothetical protein ACFLZ2_02330 [Candidatus Margulisiibacteriota bacterium]
MESCKWFGTPACPNRDKMKTIGINVDPLQQREQLPTAQEFVEEMRRDSAFCDNCPKYASIEI